MEVPEGMKQFYPSDVVLWLLKTIYGLRKASYEFLKLLLRTMRKPKYEKSKADLCLYFKWKSGRLSLWLSWVDDLINLGSKEDVKQAVKNMKQEFECDDIGEITEYVGCKIDVNKKNAQ